jgi:hypothetical protein
MPYLIDGHNLIGALPAISLSDPEDEERLMRLLARYFQRTGTRAHVYFDRRAPGARKAFRRGPLQVHFIAAPRTADQAISAHLQRLKGEARNYTVVSSDRAVRAAAARAGARILSSQDFAARLGGDPGRRREEKPPAPSRHEDLEAWLRLFRKEKNDP